jgi:hypothetical protein
MIQRRGGAAIEHAQKRRTGEKKERFSSWRGIFRKERTVFEIVAE